MPYVDCQACHNTDCPRAADNYGYTFCDNYIAPNPTHADRIRSMSDEEHARFLVHVVSDGCPPDMDWDCQKDKDGWDACDKCWERWLRQPAEDKT